METIVIQASNPEDSKAIKAFLKSLKINFKASKNFSIEALERANSIVEDHKEATEIEMGNRKSNSYSSFKDF